MVGLTPENTRSYEAHLVALPLLVTQQNMQYVTARLSCYSILSEDIDAVKYQLYLILKKS